MIRASPDQRLAFGTVRTGTSLAYHQLSDVVSTPVELAVNYPRR